MVKARQVTKEKGDWIKDNLRYDPNTGNIWWTKQNGHARRLDKPIGHLDKKTGYVYVGFRWGDVVEQYLVHRIAWFLYHDAWPKDQIDHINNIRNDNRIINLREATGFENQRNQKVQLGHSSKYKGVSWCKKTCKWRATIFVKHKAIWLGAYHNEKEAALAYNKAALEYCGEYAKINIIEPLDTGVTNTYISSSSGELVR